MSEHGEVIREAGAPTATPPSRTAVVSPAAQDSSPSIARRAGTRFVRIFSSYGLAVVLLLTLMVLTLLGTLEQADSSLYDVQRKYFESFVLVHDFGPISVPLPGATLVLGLLAVNLFVGGVMRMRKGASTAGILIVHLGILLLFGGSLVEFLLSDKGRMMVWEGQTSDEFLSYFDWEIAVRERKSDGSAVEIVLPHDRLEALHASDKARFRSDRLPFDVEVTGWTRNAEPVPSGPASAPFEGWRIHELGPLKQAEGNTPAAYVTLASKTPGSPSPQALLWGGSGLPWVATADGRRFEVDLRQQRWVLPFSITLKEFVHKVHAGVSVPREFTSNVVKTEGGVGRDVHITMNAPLRHEGYTFYQSDWGPQPNQDPNPKRFYSIFSVVRNPSDQIPMLSCWVIALGLLLHFGTKLYKHIRAESKVAAHSRNPA